MATVLWTKDQLKLAYHLYCLLPFGRLHSRNKDIVQLASLIDRTPSALAMKLNNFASLDPAITSSGRKGLPGASALDRKVWAEFHADWERLALECERLRRKLGAKTATEELTELESADAITASDFRGETRRAIIEQRIKQHFFRRAVLSSYGSRCCMSRLSEPRLLVASHIVPWSRDKANRLNPSNGLSLSAIHDRAFDKGLLTLSDDLRVILSKRLRKLNDEFVQQVFLPLEGQSIERPKRFVPDPVFVAHHRDKVFVDNRKG